MTWKEYQGILRRSKASNATGGGDNTVDPNPSKNPNNFLAPLANQSALHIAGIIIAYLLIVYLVILITKKLAYKIPTL